MPSTRSNTSTPKKTSPQKVESPFFKKKRPATSTPSSRPSKKAKTAPRVAEEFASETEESADDGSAFEEGDEGDEDALSDELDDSDFDEKVKAKAKRSPAKRKPQSDAGSPVKLAKGQTVVGRVVEAPKKGRVPPGRISQNTLDFLAKMADPVCNDREWFRLHEPVYRLAEKEWVDFIDALIDKVGEVDDQIPALPPKDLIHRIYRDIRFSNDKTPYKRSFSASFSRSGRKGIFAGYHISVRPGGSLLAAGVWCPNKNELASIRHHLLHNPSRLRQVISSKSFVSHFGAAKPHPKGQRQNVYGAEDELKTAPKGVDKGHKDIDLLKLRSIAVHKTFTDAEVLSPNFLELICRVVGELRPFVHCLNDYITLPVEEDDEDEDEE